MIIFATAIMSIFENQGLKWTKWPAPLDLLVECCINFHYQALQLKYKYTWLNSEQINKQAYQNIQVCSYYFLFHAILNATEHIFMFILFNSLTNLR